MIVREDTSFDGIDDLGRKIMMAPSSCINITSGSNTYTHGGSTWACPHGVVPAWAKKHNPKIKGYVKAAPAPAQVVLAASAAPLQGIF